MITQISDYSSSIEIEFTAVGVTAVEDELQDEVQDTLKSLRDAHIKVWMLTGDKLETAINIGHSSGLLKSDDSLIVLNADDDNVSEMDIKHFFKRIDDLVCYGVTDRQRMLRLVCKASG